jgi:alkylation response protein AidB-like acyl-CoA dehydrogenase
VLQAAYLLSRVAPDAARGAVTSDELATDAVQIAKYFAGEAGHSIAYAAMPLLGGIGVDVDYPVHRYYLWARQIELTLGSSASALAAIGERLARES